MPYKFTKKSGVYLFKKLKTIAERPIFEDT